jgi:hypothetical protein
MGRYCRLAGLLSRRRELKVFEESPKGLKTTAKGSEDKEKGSRENVGHS